MKSFDQYMLIKSLAETIVYYDVDADHLCESIISQIQENGIDNLDEGIMDGFNRFVQGVARGGAGVVGAPFRMAGDAAGAIGGMAQRAGRYVSDKYAAGVKAQAEKQVEDRLKGLADAMMALGISQQHVNATLKTVRNVVQQRGVTADMTRAGIERQAKISGARAGRQAVRQTAAMRQQQQSAPVQAQAAPQAQPANWSGLGRPAQQAQAPVDNPLAPKTWVA